MEAWTNEAGEVTFDSVDVNSPPSVFAEKDGYCSFHYSGGLTTGLWKTVSFDKCDGSFPPTPTPTGSVGSPGAISTHTPTPTLTPTSTATPTPSATNTPGKHSNLTTFTLFDLTKIDRSRYNVDFDYFFDDIDSNYGAITNASFFFQPMDDCRDDGGNVGAVRLLGNYAPVRGQGHASFTVSVSTPLSHYPLRCSNLRLSLGSSTPSRVILIRDVLGELTLD
jgi:hypothetical protein